MGKRKATRIASLKASKTLEGALQSQLDALNRAVNNLTVLLRKETDKNADLEAKLAELESKLVIKKAPKKKKPATSIAATEAVQG